MACGADEFPRAVRQDGDMERVLGIGGYFMRAADPVALGAWYRDVLGLDAMRTACGVMKPC